MALYHGLADVSPRTPPRGPPPRFPLEPLPGSASAGAGATARALVPALRRGARRRGRRARAGLGRPRGASPRSSRTCSSPRRPTTATSTAATRSTSSTRRSRHSTPPGGSTRRRFWPRSPAQLAFAERMEEANSWRHPVDIVSLLEGAFDDLQPALQDGATRRGTWSAAGAACGPTCSRPRRATILDSLLAALRDGATEVELASIVSHAAAARIARFPTSNEFGDWDTALHTFTFANAVEQGLRRSPSPALLRGVLDAAMSVYLDRFLNVPATRLPEPGG